MKRYLITLFALLSATFSMAQGWPEQYKGVMLQGFYWDSFSDSKWTKLESQADELAQYFNLLWIPQSANCGGTSMGYDDLYWFNNYNSSFGNEAQLRSLITTLQSKGVGTIADVVINHRKTLTTWTDFPIERVGTTIYKMLPSDICANDDGGKTAEWAGQNGQQLSRNNDTGEDWGGMRDLDHNSQNVQTIVKAYLDFLLKDLGYAGFRYDMVKGYAGKFTGMYNAYSKPTYSVGEYWDGNPAVVKNWLNATKVNGQIQSAVFDFPFRYTVRDAANGGDWTKLGNGGVATDKSYQRYAVTFIENHDTEYRSSSAQQDPIRKDTIAGNAFLLAMPGTPCVFLKHWMDCKHDIKNMILVRNFVGINNQSSFSRYAGNNDYYAVTTIGDNGKLLAVMGKGTGSYNPSSQWKLAVNGYHYAYYLEASKETAWTDLPSGKYDHEPTATLRAISAAADAKIVYTFDGSEPTASSKSVARGTKVTLPEGTTVMKIGLLAGGKVTGGITRNYEIEKFNSYDITVYVNTDKVGWDNVNFWTWGGSGLHAPENSSWPGDKETSTTTIFGHQWFSKSYTITLPDDYVNFVFSSGTGSPQTVNVEDITKDSYFMINAELEDGKHTVTRMNISSGIDGITGGQTADGGPVKVYSPDGRLLRSLSPDTTPSASIEGLRKGIYIVNGKKIIKD